MAYNKYYFPTIWVNSPSVSSPINQTNLNHIESGVNEVDNRIVIIDQNKIDRAELNNNVKDISVNAQSGVIVITRYNGTQSTIDLAIEKVVTNFTLVGDDLVLRLADGSEQRISLTRFIDTYTFGNTNTIVFTVNGRNVTAVIPNGAITIDKFDAGVLATLQQYVLDAQTAKGQAEYAAQTAQGWAIGGTGFEGNNAKDYSVQSESWAIGGTGERSGEDSDNSKYYSQQSESQANRARDEADRAAAYSEVVAPTFRIDFDRMMLVQESAGTGVRFELSPEKRLLFEFI